MLEDLQVPLLNHEEVVFESEAAVLTNQRLIATPVKRGTRPPEAFLRDIESYDRQKGGQESRMSRALRFAVVGTVLVLIDVLTDGSLPTILAVIVFLVGSISVVVAMYLALSSLTRIRPHTMVTFKVPGGRDVLVFFPGFDSPDADKLTRAYSLAKRRL